MKKTITLIAALMLAACYSASADITVTNASGGTTTISGATTNFLTQLMGWGTSRFASGLTWPTNDLDIATGGRYVNNLQWANYVALTKNFGAWYVGAEMDNAGVAGVVQQVSARGGYTLSNAGDLRLKAGVNVGYNTQTKSAVLQPEIGGEKMITTDTFAEAFIGYPFSPKGTIPQYPDVRIGVGATF